MIAGRLNKEIGAQLGVTLRTIKTHRARVMQKIGAGSAAELVRLAQKTQPDSICILDDDASVRSSIVQLLDSDGLTALSFEDAEVFFAHVRSHAVSLALVDVWMPETSGLQVQARLREVSPETKVIMMERMRALFDERPQGNRRGCYEAPPWR